MQNRNYELYIGALDCSQRLVHFQIETPADAQGMGIMSLHQNVSMSLIYSDTLFTLFNDGIGMQETNTMIAFRSQGIALFWPARRIRVLNYDGRLIHVEL